MGHGNQVNITVSILSKIPGFIRLWAPLIVSKFISFFSYDAWWCTAYRYENVHDFLFPYMGCLIDRCAFQTSHETHKFGVVSRVR